MKLLILRRFSFAHFISFPTRSATSAKKDGENEKMKRGEFINSYKDYSYDFMASTGAILTQFLTAAKWNVEDHLIKNSNYMTSPKQTS